jgi:hypothetical protein
LSPDVGYGGMFGAVALSLKMTAYELNQRRLAAAVGLIVRLA